MEIERGGCCATERAQVGEGWGTGLGFTAAHLAGEDGEGSADRLGHLVDVEMASRSQAEEAECQGVNPRELGD